MIINYFLSFIFIFFAELFLTLYAIKASEHKIHPASIFATMNTILYCLNIENVVTDKYCIIFAALGAYLGTWLSIKISKNY